MRALPPLGLRAEPGDRRLLKDERPRRPDADRGQERGHPRLGEPHKSPPAITRGPSLGRPCPRPAAGATDGNRRPRLDPSPRPPPGRQSRRGSGARPGGRGRAAPLPPPRPRGPPSPWGRGGGREGSRPGGKPALGDLPGGSGTATRRRS